MKNSYKKLMLGTIIVFSSLTVAPLAFAVDMASPPNSLVVDDTGKVGVGTALPTSKLSVYGNSATSTDVQVLVHNTDTTNPGVAKTLFVIKK